MKVGKPNAPTPDVEKIARDFHDTYERLAPLCGYETRKDTKQFDPTSPNGLLMIAVCGEVAERIRAPLVAALRSIRDSKATDAHVLKVMAGEALTGTGERG